MRALGVRLDELDDWNCCGATEYFTQDKLTATSVIARNLAIVDSQHDQLVAPCAACFLNLKKTDKLLSDDAATNAKVNQATTAVTSVRNAFERVTKRGGPMSVFSQRVHSSPATARS